MCQLQPRTSVGSRLENERGFASGKFKKHPFEVQYPGRETQHRRKRKKTRDEAVAGKGAATVNRGAPRDERAWGQAAISIYLLAHPQVPGYEYRIPGSSSPGLTLPLNSERSSDGSRRFGKTIVVAEAVLLLPVIVSRSPRDLSNFFC